MARLASEVKMGFYATSTKSIDKVFNALGMTIEQDAHIIDPCCGEGEAISHIGDKFNSITYGVELDILRSQKAFTKLNTLLNADALNGVKRAVRWAGLLFLNPPYGTDAQNNRLESMFLQFWGGTVCMGGYMMLVVNPSSANDKSFINWLQNQNYQPIVTLYDEECEEYKKYSQYFIILKRVSFGYRHEINSLREKINISSAINVDDYQHHEDIVVPAGIKPSSLEEKKLNFWKMDELVSKSKIQDRFEKEIFSSSNSFSSLEELNEGQKQFLIASGAIDKPLKRYPDSKGLILKGTVRKTSNEFIVYGDSGEVKSSSIVESFSTEVYGLDLDNMEFIKYT